MNKRVENVDQYLLITNLKFRQLLADLRSQIKKNIPEASEVISYGIPTYKIGKRSIVGFGANNNYCSLYVMSTTLLDQFESEIKGHTRTKSCVHFTPENLLSGDLIRRIILASKELHSHPNTSTSR